VGTVPKLGGTSTNICGSKFIVYFLLFFRLWIMVILAPSLKGKDDTFFRL
jgi:hypothetical protein